MTKKILILFSCVLIAYVSKAQSIYTYSVNSIEGVNKPLSAYTGKKILVITLPTQQNAGNDSVLHSLDSIGIVYPGQLQIVGVPAYEDGYTPALKSSLTQWYRSILSTAVVVTDGMYTRKTSGSQQHPLFQWLTDKNKNSSFDQDVTGITNKFFIWTDGSLTSVLGAPVRLGGAVMNDLLQSQ